MMDRPVPPDAIFVANDHMALGVLDRLRHRMGLEVPGDVSVVGYDDVPPAAGMAHDLSTIRQAVEAMVAASVAMLLQLIEGAPRPGPCAVSRLRQHFSGADRAFLKKSRKFDIIAGFLSR